MHTPAQMGSLASPVVIESSRVATGQATRNPRRSWRTAGPRHRQSRIGQAARTPVAEQDSAHGVAAPAACTSDQPVHTKSYDADDADPKSVPYATCDFLGARIRFIRLSRRSRAWRRNRQLTVFAGQVVPAVRQQYPRASLQARSFRAIASLSAPSYARRNERMPQLRHPHIRLPGLTRGRTNINLIHRVFAQNDDLQSDCGTTSADFLHHQREAFIQRMAPVH